MAAIISLEEFENAKTKNKDTSLTSDYKVDVYLKLENNELGINDYAYDLKEILFLGKAILNSKIYKDILDVLYHDIEISARNNKLLEYITTWEIAGKDFLEVRYIRDSLENYKLMLKMYKSIHKEQTISITDLEYDRYISKSNFLYPLMGDILEFELLISKLLKDSTDVKSVNYDKQFNHYLKKVYDLTLEFKHGINSFYDFYFTCFKIKNDFNSLSKEDRNYNKDILYITNTINSINSELTVEEINTLQNIVSFYNNKYNLNFNKMYINPFSKENQTPIAKEALIKCKELIQKKIRYA